MMALTRHEVRLARGGSYTITVGPGAVGELSAAVAPLRAAAVVVVSDSNVEPLHGRRLAGLLSRSCPRVEVLAFPAGEASKTRGTKSALEDRMIALGCGRDSAVVAVGGGVTGDLAGFVAATYMRGIPWVQVPTSLLAMADASIGGKTGVDHPAGKNLIGAFHQPSAVLSDTDLLATLPAAELRSGLAEVVKAGIVGDADLFGEMESRAADLAAADPAAVAGPLGSAIRIKAAVVSEDEEEAGRRATLNFGHTIGHAVERLTGYTILHGEAVSAGMVTESRIAARLGLLPGGDAARIESLLRALGLPVSVPPGATPEAILEAAALDKKAREGRLRLVLPRRIGEMARDGGMWTLPVPEGLLLEVLSGL